MFKKLHREGKSAYKSIFIFSDLNLTIIPPERDTGGGRTSLH